MTRKRKTAFISTAVGLAVVIAALTITTFLRSHEFERDIRGSVITALRNLTGGRTDIGAVTVSWHSLTVNLNGLTVRGSEPVSAPPLFTAPSIRLRLRITSLLKGEIDIASLVVDRPALHLFVGPEGNSNIPRAARDRVLNNLLDFSAGHVEVRDGIFEANFRRIPVTLTGDNFKLSASYLRSGPRYDVRLSSTNLKLDTSGKSVLRGAVQFHGYIQRDKLIFDK
ncbi:MAG: AsmA family protein, partial [Acidobacteriaceae bacterium]|nr:AsmA family protein [Acidobacteriaceae bacterium]